MTRANETLAVKIAAQCGLVVRQAALKKCNKTVADLAGLLEYKPLAESDTLVSFGPVFGGDVLDTLTKRLDELGLEYFEDYFDLRWDHPEWLELHAVFDATAS